MATKRKSGVTKRIHVNQHNIKHNQKPENIDEPLQVLTVKTYKSNDYANEVIIYGQDGKEAARLVYRPDHPLSCGAHVWIETKGIVELDHNLMLE